VSRAYLDASAIIYLIEAQSPLHAAAVHRVERLRDDPESRLLTSRLSLLECRVKPRRDGNDDLLAKYDAFFERRRLVIVDVTAAVVERATHLRARHRFKTPDAIHLATAIEEHADLFLTGDNDLKRCPDLKVEILQP
jgi:predicted nucleic acid-binding protein